MRVGVIKESYADEKRVAVVPADLARLKKKSVEFVVERGAGLAAGYPDSAYEKAGASLADRAEVFERSDLMAQVRGLGQNPGAGQSDVDALKAGQSVIAFLDPLAQAHTTRAYAEKQVSALSMELMPRITRAQSMDALSSMASVAGYHIVLLAADALPKMFPMSMTAAGTLQAAKVFVIGAGVAGLQAIATAKRLGAKVEAFDIRPEVKDQVVSVGGKFVEIELEGESDKDGYAKEQSVETQKKQQELMAKHVTGADVVITTAAIPGRKAPVLVTQTMVEQMSPGSVVVDLAAETGGNCELTQAGERVYHNEVTIIGPANIASSHAYHASQMYSRNVVTFLNHLIDDEGKLVLDPEDEITGATLVTHNGSVIHPRVKPLLEGDAS
ncbi:MAG: Re/Si-specific NAD(P)(+) transhydrogenase subunit alpha [Myxococcota bacterium]